MELWYILWSFGISFPVLVCCTKKNLVTLDDGHLLEPGNGPGLLSRIAVPSRVWQTLKTFFSVFLFLPVTIKEIQESETNCFIFFFFRHPPTQFSQIGSILFLSYDTGRRTVQVDLKKLVVLKAFMYCPFAGRHSFVCVHIGPGQGCQIFLGA
jgi:hypothetical protein